MNLKKCKDSLYDNWKANRTNQWPTVITYGKTKKHTKKRKKNDWITNGSARSTRIFWHQGVTNLQQLSLLKCYYRIWHFDFSAQGLHRLSTGFTSGSFSCCPRYIASSWNYSFPLFHRYNHKNHRGIGYTKLFAQFPIIILNLNLIQKDFRFYGLVSRFLLYII